MQCYGLVRVSAETLNAINGATNLGLFTFKESNMNACERVAMVMGVK